MPSRANKTKPVLAFSKSQACACPLMCRVLIKVLQDSLFLVQPNIITIEWPCHSQMLYGYAAKNVPFKTALYIGSLADDST